MNGIFNYTKWPWGEKSRKFPESYKGGSNWPKLSIIIPSYNQGPFIEETLLSVINQNYPNLELIVVDGGSTDGTLATIKKYEEHIFYWVSEKDRGQSHAINKGMERATGEWIAWLNSDDCYLKNAFYHLFLENDLERYEFLFGNYRMGESLSDSRTIKVMSSSMMKLSNVLRFFYGIDYIIPSQSVFIKKDLAKKVGPVNESLHYCMDVDWYCRVATNSPLVWKYPETICFFRFNSATKTGSFDFRNDLENHMGKEAESIALKYSHQLNFFEKMKFKNLYNYYLHYSKEPWKYTNCSLAYLLKLIILHPTIAISDRRILGLLKRKVLFKNLK